MCIAQTRPRSARESHAMCRVRVLAKTMKSLDQLIKADIMIQKASRGGRFCAPAHRTTFRGNFRSCDVHGTCASLARSSSGWPPPVRFARSFLGRPPSLSISRRSSESLPLLHIVRSSSGRSPPLRIARSSSGRSPPLHCTQFLERGREQVRPCASLARRTSGRPAKQSVSALRMHSLGVSQ
jgi:hypothetical protein